MLVYNHTVTQQTLFCGAKKENGAAGKKKIKGYGTSASAASENFKVPSFQSSGRSGGPRARSPQKCPKIPSFFFFFSPPQKIQNYAMSHNSVYGAISLGLPKKVRVHHLSNILPLHNFFLGDAKNVGLVFIAKKSFHISRGRRPLGKGGVTQKHSSGTACCQCFKNNLKDEYVQNNPSECDIAFFFFSKFLSFFLFSPFFLPPPLSSVRCLTK